MNVEVLLDSFELLWKGMATILIAMVLICFMIFALNFLTREKPKKNKK